MGDVRLSLDEARSLAMQVLEKAGLDGPNREAVTARMIEAERDECHSHGLFRLPC
ncbi:MAG: hypothetical protein AAFY06_15280 [Pseudomonadota bacterium]